METQIYNLVNSVTLEILKSVPLTAWEAGVLNNAYAVNGSELQYRVVMEDFFPH
ncbi:MAG: hypothetical protein ACO26H_02170 [Sediminibacterium sp.]